MPTFCRHNRFFAECPICTKGTVLDPERQSQRRPRASTARKTASPAGTLVRSTRGPFASVGPYDGVQIRLESVAGGLRLAAWRGGQIERVAPVMEASDVPELLGEAAGHGLLPALDAPDAAPAEAGAFGFSGGRAGELQDELRVERLEDGRVRVARWIMRPNRGWELQEAPVMLPAQRFTLAFETAARRGVLVSGSPVE